jgi:hypothetical protein
MSMVERFFSLKYAGKGEIFEGLDIWNDEKYRELQGTYPVISLSFANVKETDYLSMKKRINRILTRLYADNSFLRDSGILKRSELEYFDKMSEKMDETDASDAINCMAEYLSRYYGKKVIVLLDEYDTPMQEAYLNGFWNEMVAFTRNLLNATFKTNRYLERGLITGITRISKESMFSDLNNLKVVTTTSSQYATAFGFTEEEAFAALDEYDMSSEKENVRYWYDGFVFGKHSGIYNPWSILNFIESGEYTTHWANTSANSLAGKLIREGNPDIKEKFETLIQGGTIETELDEQIVYDQLGKQRGAVWSLLLASGYLKVVNCDITARRYELTLTNHEVKEMFQGMISSWFSTCDNSYNDFVKALLLDDVEAMNDFMNDIALNCFSSFDTVNNITGRDAPERFYHGFVLGLIVDLAGRFQIKSNRESGFGRYDVMLIPLNKNKDNAYIIEFKVKKRSEATLEDTLANAHIQIEEKQYAQELISLGVSADNIRKYGFAFEGKTVLIG